MTKVLITGSTGTVGSQVIDALQNKDIHIRALVRDKNKTAQFPSHVEVVVGDLLDPTSVEHALTGVDKVYLLNAVVPDELTQGLIVVGLAKRMGIRHLVYHSVFDAERFKDVPHFASKLAIEEALKQINLPHTVLRPNYFFQNDAVLKDALIDSGVYPVPLGEEGISAVDVRDIADAAAIVLFDDTHIGKTYDLVGPHRLSGPGAASIWSEALDKPVTYTGEHFDDYEKQLRQLMPAWAAFDIRAMFQGYVDRGFAADDAAVITLSSLLGKPPRNYKDFVQESVALFLPQGHV